MQHAAHLPKLPSRRSLVAPMVALVLGAGAAFGINALINDDDLVGARDSVIVLESSEPGDATAGGVAVGSDGKVVVPYLSHGSTGSGSDGVSAKHEDATGAAIGSGAEDADLANRTDPHGPAQALHNR